MWGFLHLLVMHNLRWSQQGLFCIFYCCSEAGWTSMKSHSAVLALPGVVALGQCRLGWGGGGGGRCLLAAQPSAEGPGLESRV